MTREIIVQIGANTGQTDNDPVFAFLNRNKGDTNDFTCVLIEPTPCSYARLAKVYDFVTDKHIILAAGSDRPGVQFLYEDNRADGENISQHASLHKDHVLAMGHREDVISRYSAPRLTLANILADLALPYVSWLQVDTEGHDATILRSLASIDAPIDTIQFEYIHFQRSAKSDSELTELLAGFVDRGYQLFRHRVDLLLAPQGGWSGT
jgi:hypothetical protein